MALKEQILTIAADLGFHRAVVASLQPMLPERQRYQNWLDRGFAGSMDYLKRHSELRTSPALLYPQSLSALILSASYYTTVPACPGEHYGMVANYAVGLDYHAVLRARLRQLRSEIEKLIGRPLSGRAYTDDVALYEQGLAARHGLGFAGKNTLIIGPRLSGSFYFICELLVDLELEPDVPYKGTCG